MLLNCGVGEDSWESLGLHGDATSPSWRKSVLNTHWKDWRWSWNSNTFTTWCEELTLWKRPCFWERLRAGEGDDREWDGCMASLTRWTRVSSSLWEIVKATVETVADFIFGGSKITADGDCSHEIKRRLLLGRKVMTNLDSILKSRDITLSTKVHLVKAMAFTVVMYGCESWTIKKAEHQRIDTFQLWCWRRLLRVPWTARRSNQSILKEISPEYALEGLMLKLKLQSFGHLMWRTHSFEKTPMLGKIEG